MAPGMAAPSGMTIAGYVPMERANDLDMHRAVREGTTLILHSLPITPTGTLETQDLPFAAVREAVQARERNGGKVFVAVGGAVNKSDALHSLVRDKTLRARLVGRIVHFCTANSLDGVDVDWDLVNRTDDLFHYSVLLSELKKELRPHGLELSVLLRVWQDLGKTGLEAVDWVHLIAFNVQEQKGRHSTLSHAHTYVNHLVKTNVERVVVGLRSKIRFGVPFFGRDRMRGVRDVKSKGVIPMTHMGRVQAYSDIVKEFEPVEAQNGVPNGMWWNGARLVRQKAEWAVEQSLGGVMVWDLSQDTSRNATSLLEVIRQVQGSMEGTGMEP
eukprot:TRINITY_DN12502_c0_g1_i26.p1 TRINITY_DN12502_c0_g1~~TRINITY_DN12502_c0_g1_i26.p1  ORF type:complete len:328 (+),score=62.52 TRINITY_DN12502_c0_g1_i26:167-1150(+)